MKYERCSLCRKKAVAFSHGKPYCNNCFNIKHDWKGIRLRGTKLEDIYQKFNAH